jgi:hypothetical protein
MIARADTPVGPAVAKELVLTIGHRHLPNVRAL